MLLRNVFTKTVWDQRRALIVWAIATAAVGALYASFYPQLAGGAMANLMANFPQGLKDAFHLDDLTSAAGYLQSTPFGLLVPMVIMFYGITTGTRAIAGDEESGHLDVLLTHPVSRPRLVLQRFAALFAGALLISLVVFLAMLAIRSSAQLDTVTVAGFAAQCVNVALLGTVFGALAIALGAAIGRRVIVLTITAAVGVLTYAANTFGAQLGAPWTRTLSPFYYYIGSEPLKGGSSWADATILGAATVVLLAAGAWAFTNRDLTS
ncbi:MAG TPA: ABC transporter permease subunit [Pseudonocardiaceae bacterium]|jgi:ABC-2 type transport system permease protein